MKAISNERSNAYKFTGLKIAEMCASCNHLLSHGKTKSTQIKN